MLKDEFKCKQPICNKSTLYLHSHEESGEGQKLPAGPACESCWVVGMDVLCYETFDEFVKDLEDPRVKARVARIHQNRREPGSDVDWDKQGVLQNKGIEIRVDRKCVAKTPSAIRKALNTQRLAET